MKSLLVAKLSSNDPVVIQVHKIIFDTFSFWKLFYCDLLSHIFPYGVLHTRNGQKQHPSVRILLAILTVVELMVHVIHFTWLAQWREKISAQWMDYSPIPCLELLLTAIADSKTFFQSCRKWECINCHIHRECSEGCCWPYIVDCSLSQCVYLGSYHILGTYFNVDNDTPL